MIIDGMSINSESVRSDDNKELFFYEIINQNPSLAEGIMDKFKTIIKNLESEFGENFEDNCCKISDEYNPEDLELGLELYDVESPNMGDYLKRIKNFKDRLSQYESKLKRAKEQRMNLRTRLSNKTKNIKEKLSKKLNNIKRSLSKGLKRLRRKRKEGGGKKRHTKKRHTKKRNTKKRHTKKRNTKKRHTKKRMP